MKVFVTLFLVSAVALSAANPFTADDRLADPQDPQGFEDYLFRAYEDSLYDPSSEDSSSDEPSSDSATPLIRHRRQARDNAMELALNHDHEVGRVHGRVDVNAVGNDAQNYHAQLGTGIGSVLWRSRDQRHSLGVGGYAEQHRGRYEGFGYRSQPNFGVGVGYRFKF